MAEVSEICCLSAWDNQKWYAAIMNITPDKIGAVGDNEIDIIDVKELMPVMKSQRGKRNLRLIIKII